MPLKWFRSHRRSAEDEATRLSTETMVPKQKTKRNKSVSQRSRRSHSHGSGLRAMIGLGGSMQNELDVAAAIAEEERRMSYQTKSHRRFTIHGLTYHHKHNEEEEWSCNTTPAGSPLPMCASMSPCLSHSRHYGLGTGRMTHGRSSHTHPMTPLSPNSHPSIIFIDCPP
ncbi:hypothetical protein PHMEG_00019129 [Phytophthora megakarya]|uniref:Uncharacterized protein n=1 Tax=Phytophthora megakarya TaxID=4795 RepID=A0A225VU69_9STRA|nr:hypothetical protein PHMEG_00019129 [Phytophthora megakarya]